MGVRTLVVKGPAAARQGLRKPRASSDVDVLVEPHRFEEFVDRLVDAGWQERSAPTTPRIVELHSVTLLNASWPIDLDLHRFWPGFLLEPAEAFDVLWASRVEEEFAGIAVDVPDPPSTALILGLHTLRHTAPAAALSSVAPLAEAARTVFGDQAGSLLAARAHLLGATETCRPLLETVGSDLTAPGPESDELRRWRLNAAARGTSSAWLVHLSEAPTRRKVAIVASALFPSPRQLRLLHPETPLGPRGIAGAWFRRLGHGLVALPGAMASVRGFRRRHRPDPRA
ncbi:putative nucleotidyltransferase-like protein [Subtercola boreus]|nr:putative nucleotidyltransferase-like protein [Subtercola boreus]